MRKHYSLVFVVSPSKPPLACFVDEHVTANVFDRMIGRKSSVTRRTAISDTGVFWYWDDTLERVRPSWLCDLMQEWATAAMIKQRVDTTHGKREI